MKDKVEIFGERLKKVIEGFRAMKTFGLDEDILVAWFQVKMKISDKAARKIIACHEEFYNKILKESIFEGMENDKTM